jgi:arabinose-5-phosphate isomerase
MTAVLDAAGVVKGVFTDGDLRRALEKSTDIDGGRVDQVMTADPKTIGREKLAAEAVHVMEQHKISQLLVVDERGVLVGALNMHDLFRVKVI